MIRLSWRQRFRLFLFGSVFVYTKDLGRGKLYYYAVRCKLHGLFVDYPHGFHQEFGCPKCMKEAKAKWSASR